MTEDNASGPRPGENPYTLDDFLRARETFDFYADDPLLVALVRHHAGPEAEAVDAALRALSPRVSGEMRRLADRAATLENRIRCTQVRHFDAFDHRVDAIERAPETEALERAVFDLGLFDPARTSPWSRFAQMFLLYENGEFGVMCPVACTEGLIALASKYEGPEAGAHRLAPGAQALLDEARQGRDWGPSQGHRYGVGAQFLTELQGGSDVAANRVEAVADPAIPGAWRLHGKKFFCSAVQADMALVTAKPRGVPSADKVAVFLVPLWAEGRRPWETDVPLRNGMRIDRLKPKLGTAELPTAEVTFDGALGYPVGPLEHGLPNVVAVTLTLSRLHVAFGMAAVGLRAAREATWYAQFREAFGQPIARFPFVQNQLQDLNDFARRSAAGVFKLYGEYLALGQRLAAGLRELNQISDLAERRRRFRLRELVLLMKISVAWEIPEQIRAAISLFGGHGIVEDFSALPRLLRDAFIMELWEGPRNVLLTQMHRDFQRVADWYAPEDFVRDLLRGLPDAEVAPLADELSRVMAHPSLLAPDEATRRVCRAWDALSLGLAQAYERLALAEVSCPETVPTVHDLLARLRAAHAGAAADAGTETR